MQAVEAGILPGWLSCVHQLYEGSLLCRADEVGHGVVALQRCMAPRYQAPQQRLPAATAGVTCTGGYRWQGLIPGCPQHT